MDLVTEEDSKLLEEIEFEIKNKNVLLLLRGCPGAGKTTLANWLKEKIGEKLVTVLSTNDLFNDEQGVYRGHDAELRKAYEKTIKLAETEMTLKKVVIIIDNKNIKYWEMSPYLDIAKKYNYSIKIAEPNTPWKMDPNILVDKNVHGVDAKRIKRLMIDFHPITAEELMDKNADRRVAIKQKRKASSDIRDVSEDESSFAYIMEKQKNEEKEFRDKYPFADSSDFLWICEEYFSFKRPYLAELFQMNKCNVMDTIKMLPKEKNCVIRFERSVFPKECQIPEKRIKIYSVRKYDWLITNRILVNVDIIENDLSQPTESSRYKSILNRLKDNYEDTKLKTDTDKIINELFRIKELVAKRIEKKMYNKIDFHWMTVAETMFIFDEAIFDYIKALKTHDGMKRYLICVTGRGKHSKGHRPVLKPALLKYAENQNLECKPSDGEIRIYLQNYSDPLLLEKEKSITYK